MSKQKTIAVIANGLGGVAYLPVPDSLDSGITLETTDGRKVVVDVWSLEARDSFYRRHGALISERDRFRLALVRIARGIFDECRSARWAYEVALDALVPPHDDVKGGA